MGAASAPDRFPAARCAARTAARRAGTCSGTGNVAAVGQQRQAIRRKQHETEVLQHIQRSLQGKGQHHAHAHAAREQAGLPPRHAEAPEEEQHLQPQQDEQSPPSPCHIFMIVKIQSLMPSTRANSHVVSIGSISGAGMPSMMFCITEPIYPFPIASICGWSSMATRCHRCDILKISHIPNASTTSRGKTESAILPFVLLPNAPRHTAANSIPQHTAVSTQSAAIAGATYAKIHMPSMDSRQLRMPAVPLPRWLYKMPANSTGKNHTHHAV